MKTRPSSGGLPTISRSTLLNKTKVEYGNFAINHVSGCAHGCNYPCYAKLLEKRCGRIKNDSEWLQPKLVGNALELLDREILKRKERIGFVHLSFMTDPFMYDFENQQPFHEIQGLTLRIIQKLNHHGIKSTILTKGLYPEELLDKGLYGSENLYGITLVSLDHGFKKQFEPFAAPIEGRIERLKRLHEGRLKTWVSIEPYPTPNIIEQDLETILNEVSFVDTIIFGRMNYNRIATGYKEKVKFYTQCVSQVEKFCTERGIRFHIKKKTPGSIPNEGQIFSGCDVTE